MRLSLPPPCPSFTHISIRTQICMHIFTSRILLRLVRGTSSRSCRVCSSCSFRSLAVLHSFRRNHSSVYVCEALGCVFSKLKVHMHVLTPMHTNLQARFSGCFTRRVVTVFVGTSAQQVSGKEAVRYPSTAAPRISSTYERFSSLYQLACLRCLSSPSLSQASPSALETTKSV